MVYKKLLGCCLLAIFWEHELAYLPFWTIQWLDYHLLGLESWRHACNYHSHADSSNHLVSTYSWYTISMSPIQMVVDFFPCHFKRSDIPHLSPLPYIWIFLCSFWWYYDKEQGYSLQWEMLAPYLFLPFFLKFILQCFCLAIAQSLWFLHLDLSWCRRNYLGINQRYTWMRSWLGPFRCYSNWCYVPIFLDLIGSLHPFHLWNKVYLISSLRSVQDLTENSWTRNIVKDLKDPFFILDC